MSYLDFQSDGIEYRLMLTTHDTIRKEPLDGLDALVVETGATGQEMYADCLSSDPGLRNYLDEIGEKGIVLYSVDSKASDHSEDGGYLKGVVSCAAHLIALPLAIGGLSRFVGVDEIPSFLVGVSIIYGQAAIMGTLGLANGVKLNNASKLLAKANSYLSLLRQCPIEELRNALAARKIKEGVVPHLQEKYPKRFSTRRPRIGILYGAAHTGIQECLKSEARADFTLRLHQWYGLRFALDRSTLEKVTAYELGKDGTVQYEQFKVELGILPESPGLKLTSGVVGGYNNEEGGM